MGQRMIVTHAHNNHSYTILMIVLDSIRPILVEVFDTVTSLDLMVGERIVDPPHHFGRTVVNLHHMI